MCGKRGIKITHIKNGQIVSITWLQRSLSGLVGLMRDLSPLMVETTQMVRPFDARFCGTRNQRRSDTTWSSISRHQNRSRR